jgi:protein-tyrosine-phosphatase
MTGDEACENAVKAAECFGCDISAHRARRITSYVLDETDKFVCMTPEHTTSHALYVPRGKITVLAGGIPDPYGGNLETYLTCANSIKNALVAQFEEIIAEAEI